MEQKSDVVVGLNHTANVVIPVIILGLFIGNPLILLAATLGFTFYASSYVSKKFKFEDNSKVAMISTIGYLAINLIFLLGFSFFQVKMAQGNVSLMEVFLARAGFTDAASIGIQIVFFAIYYFLSLKGIEMFKAKHQATVQVETKTEETLN